MILLNISFIGVLEHKLWSSASDIATTPVQDLFVVNNVVNENGLIVLEGSLKSRPKIKRFMVTAFGEGFYNVYYEDKSTTYSLRVRVM